MVHARGRRPACPNIWLVYQTRSQVKCERRHAGSAGACTADAGRRPGASPSRNPPPPRRRPYPWCVSRPFGTGTRQMVHRKSRRRTPGAFGNGARWAVPHRKPRTARRTSRRFAAEHVRRYSCAEVTRSERWPRHQAVRCFHHASSVRAASPDARRAQVTSANARREGAQGLAFDQVTEAVAALDISQNMASNQHVSGVWRFHGQGVSVPGLAATPRAAARRPYGGTAFAGASASGGLGSLRSRTRASARRSTEAALRASRLSTGC